MSHICEYNNLLYATIDLTHIYLTFYYTEVFFYIFDPLNIKLFQKVIQFSLIVIMINNNSIKCHSFSLVKEFCNLKHLLKLEILTISAWRLS